MCSVKVSVEIKGSVEVSVHAEQCCISVWLIYLVEAFTDGSHTGEVQLQMRTQRQRLRCLKIQSHSIEIAQK